MKKRRVLVLGAAAHQLFSLRAIQAMGCEVVVIDRDPRAPGFQIADHFENIDIVDIESAIEVAGRYAVDAVVPLSDFGVRTAAAIASRFGLIGVTEQVAKVATDKGEMRRIWAEKGVPSANYRIVSNLQQAFDAVTELDMWPLIFKPADSRGGGSRGVSRVESASHVPQALKFAQSYYDDQRVVIEEYLEGIEHSLELLVADDDIQVLAISDKEKTPFPYRVDKSVIYPTSASACERKRIVDVACLAARAVGINVGAVHVELCSTDDGPKMFELGARFGGGHTPDPIVRYLTGVNTVQETTSLLLGERRELPDVVEGRGCVYRFLTPNPGRMSGVAGLEKVRQTEGILDVGLWVKVGDTIGEVQTGSDRSGYIVAGGESRLVAVSLADWAESTLRFQYCSDLNGRLDSQRPAYGA